MKRIKKLTESDINRIVKKVINEQSPYDGDPYKLYKMYSRMIDSEINNINSSIEELNTIKEDIMTDENLNDEDKNELESWINYYLNNLGF